jgi:hypothetical protein
MLSNIIPCASIFPPVYNIGYFGLNYNPAFTVHNFNFVHFSQLYPFSQLKQNVKRTSSIVNKALYSATVYDMTESCYKWETVYLVEIKRIFLTFPSFHVLVRQMGAVES